MTTWASVDNNKLLDQFIDYLYEKGWVLTSSGVITSDVGSEKAKWLAKEFIKEREPK